MTEMGFWISPDNDIYPIDLNYRHILFIIDNPDLFGWTREYIKNIYEKHGEDMIKKLEGCAREEIILDAVRQGWIRIRHYIRPVDRFSFNVNELNAETKSRIRDFIIKAVSGAGTLFKKRYSGSNVAFITSFSSGIRIDFDSILKGDFIC